MARGVAATWILTGVLRAVIAEDEMDIDGAEGKGKERAISALYLNHLDSCIVLIDPPTHHRQSCDSGSCYHDHNEDDGRQLDQSRNNEGSGQRKEDNLDGQALNQNAGSKQDEKTSGEQAMEVKMSSLIRNCTNCIFILKSHQVRSHPPFFLSSLLVVSSFMFTTPPVRSGIHNPVR